MELTKEVIEAQGFTEDQIKAVNEFGVDFVAGIKKTYDEQYSGAANANAEKILSGAATRITETTKVDRNQGEKVGDFMDRAWIQSNESKLQGLEASKKGYESSKKEYEDKVKNFKGNDDIQSSLTEITGKYDLLQAKEAKFDQLVSDGFEDKFNAASSELVGMKKAVAFGEVKPAPPKEVNEYEFNAKWDEFTSGVLKDNEIEFVDGKAVAVSKENKHKVSTLKELLAKDSNIQELMKGRAQVGTGTISGGVKLDGIPFELPKDATQNDISKAIENQLKESGLLISSPEYSKQFTELMTKVREGQKTAA